MSVSVKKYVERLVSGNDLDFGSAEELMKLIMGGKVSPVNLAAILSALRVKGETVDEIAAFAAVMRTYARRVKITDPKIYSELVDTCGTGGDSVKTFNISTLAALVTAAAGVPIAKHGNRAVSGKCGSADLLESLGVNVNCGPDKVAESITATGFGFIFAPVFHPAMKHAMPVRRELGIRTVFNILGPLTNPAYAPNQIMGVFDKKLVEPIAHVLARLGVKRGYIFHSEPGIDEIVPYERVYFASIRNGRVELYDVGPEDFGQERFELAEIRGGNVEANTERAVKILKGEDRGVGRKIVLINAAYAYMCGSGVTDFDKAYSAVEEALDSGAVIEKLKEIIGVTGGNMSRFNRLFTE